jgi:hypothetical protein
MYNGVAGSFFGDPKEMGEFSGSGSVWSLGYKHGPGIEFADDDSFVYLDTTTGSFTPWTHFSVICRFRPANVSAGLRVIIANMPSNASAISNTTGFALCQNAQEINLRLGRGGSNALAIDTGNILTAGEWYTCAFSVEDGRQYMIVNGTLFTGNTTVVPYPYNWTNTRTLLGANRQATPAQEFVGVIDMAMIWQKFMFQSELISLVRDPWQMFEADRRVRSERNRQYCYRRALR